MEAKAYLEDLWQIDRRIQDKQALAERYMTMACRATSRQDALRCSGTTHKSRVEDYGVKLVDIQREIAQDVERLRTRRRTARAAIDALQSAKERDVLELRYFSGLGWEEIGHRMHYERTQVWRLHARALQNLQPLLPLGDSDTVSITYLGRNTMQRKPC